MAQLVKAWESKNAQRAVRGAGLGLMAVSLAACGGSDDSSTSTPTTPTTPTPVTPLNALFTAGIDTLTGTSVSDVFTGTHATLSALDSVNGGAGSDTVIFIDDSADGTAFPAVSMTSIETVAVRNLSGDAAKAGTAEAATVSFQALAAGQTVTIAGVSFTAGDAGATAAQVAAAFTSATITATTAAVGGGNLHVGANSDPGKAAADTRAEVNAVLATNGYTSAAGGQVNSVLFTSNATNPSNVTDLTVTGTAVTGQNQIVTFTVKEAADNALANQAVSMTINGVAVTSSVVTGTENADTKAIADAVAAAINGYVGKTVASVAMADGTATVTVSSDSTLSIANLKGTVDATDITFGAVTLAQPLVAAAAPTVTVVDGVAAVSAASNAMTVDASAWDGVTTIKNLASTDAVTFSGMAAKATVVVEDVVAGALATTTANFDAEVTNGAADSVSLVLDGNTNAGTVTIGAGFETVNITAVGKNKIAGLDTGAKTVTIAGSGDLTITASLADATTVDGSAATGKLGLTSGVAKVAISTGSGADKITLEHAASSAHEFSVKAGAGNDTVVIKNITATGDLTDNKVVVDGGAGVDTLEVKAGLAVNLSALSAADYAKKGITGFEKLAVSDVLGEATINAERLGLNSDVSLKAGFNHAISKLDNLANNANVTIAAASSNTLTAVVKGAADAGRTADTLNFTLAGEHAGGTVSYGTLLAANVETININSTSGKETSLVTADTNTVATLTTVDAEAINISGNVKFILTNALADTFTSLETINASANTAGVDISAANVVQGISIIGSAVSDTITGAAGSDVINAGAGNDVIKSSAGVDMITFGAGNDVYDINSAAHSGVTAATADKITDFSNDVIDLAGIDAVAEGGDNAFTLVAQSTVQARVTAGGATTLKDVLADLDASDVIDGGKVGAFQFGGNTYVFANVTNEVSADTDVLIQLNGAHTLTADNFVL